jgi:hypothetical protein
MDSKVCILARNIIYTALEGRGNNQPHDPIGYDAALAHAEDCQSILCGDAFRAFSGEPEPEVIPIEDPIELTWRSARRLLIDAVGIRGQSVTPRTTIGRLGVSRALIRLAQIDRLAPHVNNVHSLRNRVDKLDILTIYHTCT